MVSVRGSRLGALGDRLSAREQNLILRLTELTSMRVNPEPIVLRLTDKELFDHPFIFMSDVGWQKLSVEELSALERYLDAGGFLWVDDFWGQAEWDNFARNVGNLRAGWRWRVIPNDHPILTIVYPLQACPQVPVRIFYAQSGLPVGSAAGSSSSKWRYRGCQNGTFHGSVRHT